MTIFDCAKSPTDNNNSNNTHISKCNEPISNESIWSNVIMLKKNMDTKKIEWD